MNILNKIFNVVYHLFPGENNNAAIIIHYSQKLYNTKEICRRRVFDILATTGKSDRLLAVLNRQHVNSIIKTMLTALCESSYLKLLTKFVKHNNLTNRCHQSRSINGSKPSLDRQMKEAKLVTGNEISL